MTPWPQSVAPAQRDLLREFERLHEQWREASEAANAIEGEHGQQLAEARRLLEYRIRADRLHQQAMQLLRDRPL